MAKLSSSQLLHAERFLVNKARLIDYYAYLSFKKEGAPADLIKELKAFRNHDGGFGHGLEPDLQLPASSVLATTVALQYAITHELTDAPFFKQAVDYLIKQRKDTVAFSTWDIIPIEAEQFPRAPWWNYTSPTSFEPNPSMEVIAYLLYAQPNIERTQLNALTSSAVNDILTASTAEQHELLCMIRLYAALPEHLQTVVYSKLSKLILQTVECDSSKWQQYTLTPLGIVDSPSSPFYALFANSLIEQNLDYLVSTQMSDGSWHPAWSWGQFEDVWAKAKLDWQGYITYKNLIVLHNFNHIEA